MSSFDDFHTESQRIEVLDVGGPLSPPLGQQDDESENWRHGDIKPENVLRFENPNSELGTLKLADFGRAKRNFLVSYKRQDVEIDKWITDAYQPPDFFIYKGERTQSRLYDVWSLGCVFFEFIIWTLHGHKWLQDFAITTNNSKENETPFWKRRGTHADLQNAVKFCIAYLLENDPECNRPQPTVMADLIKLVKQKMLVVDLPDKADIFTTGKRANTKTLLDDLDKIIEQAKDTEYLFSGVDRSNLEPLPLYIQAMQEPSRANSLFIPVPDNNRGLTTQQFNRYTHGLSDSWSYQVEEQFVSSIMDEFDRDCSHILEATDTSLCEICQHIDIDAPEPILTRKMHELKESKSCALCTMLFRNARALGIAEDELVKVTRSLGALKMNGKPKPALRLCRLYGKSVR